MRTTTATLTVPGVFFFFLVSLEKVQSDRSLSCDHGRDIVRGRVRTTATLTLYIPGLVLDPSATETGLPVLQCGRSPLLT